MFMLKRLLVLGQRDKCAGLKARRVHVNGNCGAVFAGNARSERRECDLGCWSHDRRSSSSSTDSSTMVHGHGSCAAFVFLNSIFCTVCIRKDTLGYHLLAVRLSSFKTKCWCEGRMIEILCLVIVFTIGDSTTTFSIVFVYRAELIRSRRG